MSQTTKSILGFTNLLASALAITLSGCAQVSPRVISWENYGVHSDSIKYIEVSNQWRSASDFSRRPPTQSDEIFGLNIKCKLDLLVDKSIQDSITNYKTIDAPDIILIFNEKKLLNNEMLKLVKASQINNNFCQNTILVQDIHIEYDLNGDGLTYWFPGFTVDVKLALLDKHGKIVLSKTYKTILLGLSSNTFEEQSRATILAGNDAVYEAMSEGINDLLK